MDNTRGTYGEGGWEKIIHVVFIGNPKEFIWKSLPRRLENNIKMYITGMGRAVV